MFIFRLPPSGSPYQGRRSQTSFQSPGHNNKGGFQDMFLNFAGNSKTGNSIVTHKKFHSTAKKGLASEEID